VNAISVATATADKMRSGGGTKLVSLGDIVHNGAEMARLEALGLEVVPEDADMALLVGRTVLIRAHGEPPETYRRARENGVTLIDATCPVVERLQKTVASAYKKMRGVSGQVVIFGKRGHAEVRGLSGQVCAFDGNAAVTVVENEADLNVLDFTRPIYFMAQTTSRLAEFGQLADAVRERAADLGQVTVHDTICRQVSGREEHLAEFARRFDVVVFVSGAKSSNGRVLFETVKAANPRSVKIEGPDELRPEWFSRNVAGGFMLRKTGLREISVGVCGATSTPRWLMEQVAATIVRYEN
jgi:4-hydroxy-3-methylbut-2-enyl diphosphate reductase